MKYPDEIYSKADYILQIRRQRAGWELEQRVRSIRDYYKDIYTLYQDVQSKGAQLGKLLISPDPDDNQKHMEEQRARVDKLTQALVTAGLSGDYLQLQPKCKTCQDSGMVGRENCQCRQEILNRLAYEWLSNISQVDHCTFDNFSLRYYEGEDRRKMADALAECKQYAEGFSARSRDLLFLGATGLGKTHLSLAIAAKVVSSGRLVLYASAANLFDRLADDKFGKTEGPEYKEIAYGCELLIVDDLGTEFTNRYTQSEVYSLINTRKIESRPTIINTNLTLQEIEATYGQRVFSRLACEYKAIVFTGTDIRLQKRRFAQ